MAVTEKMELYDNFRVVPAQALKEIQAGRLKGKSDINPMWRIKKLTEQFGPCGFGWRYEIIKMWIEPGGNGEISSFVHINLFVKYNGEWSEAIQGVGGSSFVSKEKNGPYVSDECYKMALTDALSVACKALGVAADIYYGKDTTKYDKQAIPATQQPTPQKDRKLLPKEKLDDIQLLAWIYKKEIKARENKQRFSLAALIENNYVSTIDEIQAISTNYEQYKLNNNL